MIYVSRLTAIDKENDYGVVLQLSYNCKYSCEAYEKHNMIVTDFIEDKRGYTGCFIGHSLEMVNQIGSSYFKPKRSLTLIHLQGFEDFKTSQYV